jgi:hypothetical protein
MNVILIIFAIPTVVIMSVFCTSPLLRRGKEGSDRRTNIEFGLMLAAEMYMLIALIIYGCLHG